jgi:tetratricopeptide (TPR) repeat protein
MYERAVNLYSDSGLANNAIALCNKILRNSPGRTQIYLKLAQLMVERGFVAEAKQNLLEYAERMQRAGRLEEAFQALKEFADLSPANEEIRLLLAEQLKAAARTDEAREQLDKLYAELQAQGGGDTRRSRATLEKIRAIDPDYVVDDSVLVPTQSKQGKTSDLVFLDLGEAAAAGKPEAPVAPAEPDPADQELRIERTTIDFSPGAGHVDAVDGLEDAWEDDAATDVPPLEFEPTSLVEEEPESGLLGEFAGAEAETEPGDDVPMLELPDDDSTIDDAPLPMIEVPDPDDVALTEEPVEAIEGLDTLEVDLDSGGGVEVPELDLEGFDDVDVVTGVVEDLVEDEPTAAAPVPAAPAGPPTVEELEERVADDPDDPELHRELGEALIGDGQRERGLEELDIALTAYEARQDWGQSERLVEELLRIEPNSARHHQKRVEAAYRRGDKGRLVDAYLGLAGALVRSGEVDRGRLVYHRVLEHDRGNEVAATSLTALEPEPEEVPEAPVARATPSAREPVADGGVTDFVDLGSLVMGESHVKDTRMRIEEEEPTGDEQRDFERMLSLFKRGIEQNLEDDDAQAHYDLGIAFKEMGLLDEAIAEFQKALRAVDGRLRTAEALGVCFFEKGQFSVAGTVLKRALESEPGGDDKKINLLYWLGRCEEEQGKQPDALKHYQRVFAVDIDFADVNTRVRQLAEAGH